MLKFIDADFKLDISNLPATIVQPLYIDQTSDVGITGLTVATPGLPFTIIISKVNDQMYNMTISAYTAALFGNIYTLTLAANTGSTATINIELDFSSPFVPVNWDNSSQYTTAIDNFDVHHTLTTPSLNDLVRQLFNSSLTALGQAKLALKYFHFKHKYLNDIIDLAIAGVPPQVGTIALTYDVDNNLSTFTTTQADRIVKITYTYTNLPVIRLRKRGTIYSELETKASSFLSSFTVDVISDTGTLIYRLATVTVNRTESIYVNPYLADYVEVNGDSNPDNIMSDYKYYRTQLMTGWAVS